jgi:putative addiction module component (TIGR02574 family)
MNTKELINEVVALPAEERALLVDSLLRSLDQPESNIDIEWAGVANKRLAELRSGKVKPIPGDGIFERIRTRLGK